MKPPARARALSRSLRPLAPRTIEPSELARVAGGIEIGSTSTSGRPEASDDTVGDYHGNQGYINNHNQTRMRRTAARRR
jgi:hypothetical protein